MFVSVDQLKSDLMLEYRQIHRQFNYQIEIELGRASKTLATALKKGFVITIRLSKKLFESDYRLAYLTCFVLIHRLNKKQTPSFLLEEYTERRNHYFKSTEPVQVKNKLKLIPEGNCYQLTEIFERVVHQHGLIFTKVNGISWSPKYSIRRIGYYLERDDIIVISKTLDHPSVPEYVVEFVVYHELLHKLLGTQKGLKKQIIHGKKFLEMERRFYLYDEANLWLKNVYPRIVKKITK
jgi:predicted metal-dependent hydrolase